MESQKKCSRCELELPLTEYTRNSSRKDGLNSACKRCHKVYRDNHYAKNKGYYIAKAKRFDRKVKEEIRRRKEKPCADCGKQYPYYVMQFDHLAEKSFEISLGFKYGKEKLEAELAKCDVVCANCHAERTHQRQVRISPQTTNLLKE